VRNLLKCSKVTDTENDAKDGL